MGSNAYIVFKTTPFDGYKLGSGFSGKKMVAVAKKRIEEAKKEGKDICIFQKPDKYAPKSKEKTDVLAPYMILDVYEIPLAFAEFDDKWGREGKYTLCYFEWKPIVQNTLFN